MYAVTIEPSALGDVAHHYAYLKEHAHSPEYPDIWYDSIVEAIVSVLHVRHGRQDVLRP